MPSGDPTLPDPPRDRVSGQSASRTVLPLGSLGPTHLGVSYGVLLAGGLVVMVSWVSSGRPGNSDLPWVAAAGLAFWLAGYGAQLLTFVASMSWCRYPIGTLVLGPLGVESAPRATGAMAAWLIGLATSASPVLLGAFFVLVEGGFRMPVLAESSPELLAPPGIGFQSPDSIWRAGAWLCWVQAVCQMFPLPRSMGRQVIAGLSSWCAPRQEVRAQASLCRRCVMVFALGTLLASIMLLSRGGASLVPRWLIGTVLGLWLWASVRQRDIEAMLTAFRHSDSVGRSEGHRPWDRIAQQIRQRRNRRRASRALDRERKEAVDAARLDEILRQLHVAGPESLSPEDREILRRVSENLRRQRSQTSSDDSD